MTTRLPSLKTLWVEDKDDDVPQSLKSWQNLSKIAVRASRWGLNLVLPPRCPVNGDIVPEVGAISPAAWKELDFIAPPFCYCCGMPFPVGDFSPEDLKSDFQCADCLTFPRPFDKARSLLTYNDGSRKMILAFKHGDAIHLHTTLAPLLTRTGLEFLKTDTIIVPVPLHWMRLLKRRYNQAAILGIEVAKWAGIECWPDALIRTRHTPPQGHKGAKDRHENVRSAFDMNPRFKDKISGRDIVLIDDVFTTGATLDECTKVLKASGAASVNVLTVARVVQN